MKLIRNVSEYEKLLWISDIPQDTKCFTQAWGRNESYGATEWIIIEKADEPQLPTPPSPCNDWFNQADLRKTDKIPQLRQKISIEVKNPEWTEGSSLPKTITTTDYLASHPVVSTQWEQYISSKWSLWKIQHIQWKKVANVYTELFTFYQSQIKLGEQFELVVGLGLLNWKTPFGQAVHRHLLVADAILEFDAKKGRFTVSPHPEGAKLRIELDMLDITDQPVHAEEEAKQFIAAAEDDPWNRADVEGILKALVHSINAQGEYSPLMEHKFIQTSQKPVVEFAPALILRKRSIKSQANFLKIIKEQLEKGGDIPPEFADLSEIREKETSKTPETGSENALFKGERYFPKPSNAEQLRIVDKLNHSTGVLVQGPPGTGKTHTIANLICHLLATGQRTLITSQTPRALQVLKGLLPKEMHGLCINLLGNGPNEQRELEASVSGILRQSEIWNEAQNARERAELETELQRYREEKASLTTQLQDIRESETYSRTIAEGYIGTAAHIAEQVALHREEFAWFRDTIPYAKSYPFSKDNLRKLLDALRGLTLEKREELSLSLPDSLSSPQTLLRLMREEKERADEAEEYSQSADPFLAKMLSHQKENDIQLFADRLAQFNAAKRKATSDRNQWVRDACHDVINGETGEWKVLRDSTQSFLELAKPLIDTADNCNIEYPVHVSLNILYNDAVELKKHFDSGGTLGWGIFRAQVVRRRAYIVDNVKVDGCQCRSSESIDKLITTSLARITIDKLWTTWDGKVCKGNSNLAMQYAFFESMYRKLEDVLELEAIVNTCIHMLRAFNILNVVNLADDVSLNKLFASCQLSLLYSKKNAITAELDRIKTLLGQIVIRPETHPLVGDFVNALDARDIDAVDDLGGRVAKFRDEQTLYGTVQVGLEKLRSHAPKFAYDLEMDCQSSCWDARLARLVDVWHWAQARNWVKDYLRKEDVPVLQQRLKQLEDSINSHIAKLASLYAWSFCCSRLTEDHQCHMSAWKQSMTRLGKGTGKHAQRHRNEAQHHLNHCREAVPAWVMPLYRIWDTVSPAPGIFDVIIVDEASQCGLEALPLLYLAKKIIIVGDDKQISPEPVGVSLDQINQLNDSLLYDFNLKSTFDLESSLFDHGRNHYPTQKVTLREHFRCMPEIIAFSNDLCYSDTPLIALRQYGSDRLPPLEHYFLSTGYREGTGATVVNKPEANALVEKVAEFCHAPSYKDKTMGVIVLQGDAQAKIIEEELLKKIGLEEMEKRRLVCGNPYSFQGDQRDVIFLSMVAAPNVRIGALTKEADVRRFNVAASRARDQMILFHSVTRDDLSPYCLRRKLLEFFEDNKPVSIKGVDVAELEKHAYQDNRQIMKAPEPFDSWFEVDVALKLLRKGYNIIPQYEVAGKFIDLVVEGGLARLAVECDGDYWHGPDKYEEDMQRQRQLERCGWTFFRVRESSFRMDKEDVMRKLCKALREMEIFPHGQGGRTNEDAPSAEPQDIPN